MKNADSQVAPRFDLTRASLLFNHIRTMLERHHEGNALAIQVERNIYLIRCGKGLLNVLEKNIMPNPRSYSTAIRELMTAPQGPKRRAGFHS